MPHLLIQRIGFLLLWLGLISYAFLLAPPDRPDTLDLITRLSTGQWQEINPVIVALFNLMGLWPLVFSALILFDGQRQKLWAWPFTLGSFAVGAFSLLPYFALRDPQAPDSQTLPKSPLLRILASRLYTLGQTIASLVLLSFGLIQGDWGDYLNQFQTSRFIHVMSLDFCALSLLCPILIKSDMAARDLDDTALFWAIASLPLLGPLAYLCLRPSGPGPEVAATEHTEYSKIC
jgi:hypothetical protein